MPPKRAAKQATTTTTDALPTQEEQAHTPENSPVMKSEAGITQAQKQALVDNLQLESTPLSPSTHQGVANACKQSPNEPVNSAPNMPSKHRVSAHALRCALIASLLH